MENEKSKLKELTDNTPISKKVALDLRKKVIKMNDDARLFGRYYKPE